MALPSDFNFKVYWMVAFMHKGHKVYLSSAYDSMVFFTQQTAVYKWPAHVFPHTDLPAHQKILYVPPINNLQFLERNSISVAINIKYLCQVILRDEISLCHLNTWTPSCLSFATNDHATLEWPQCPLLYTQWENMSTSVRTALSVWSLSGCRHWLPTGSIPRTSEWSCSLLLLRHCHLTDPLILSVNCHWFLPRDLTTTMPLLSDKMTADTGHACCHTRQTDFPEWNHSSERQGLNNGPWATSMAPISECTQVSLR